ncbi:MAG: hypothetical protein II189_02435, partial [Lachnospiraceae bacterium]|nr:hypothetical protein [Lachnospiraceae bacterium]
MKKLKRRGLLSSLSMFLTAVLISASAPWQMNVHAQSMAYNVYGELVDLDAIEYDTVHLRYRYGDEYADRFSEYPYIAWMLDFAGDDIHGYGSYREGNSQELNVVCSTFIYFALYCTGYNVPDYISVNEDDTINSAAAKIQNVRANVSTETMYSRQLLKKWGFEEHVITPSTSLTELKVGDILWVFDNDISVVDDEDEGIYDEVGASRKHVEVVYETGTDENGPYFMTVAASGTNDDTDGTPYDKRGTEVRTRYYDSLRYKNRDNSIDYMVYYRPTAALTRTAESRNYEPALISMARDVNIRVYGGGEASFANDLSRIPGTAVIGSPVYIRTKADDGTSLSAVRVSYVDSDTQETVFVDVKKDLTFTMPEIPSGSSVNISVVFDDYDAGSALKGWYDDPETGSRCYYRNGKRLTGFQTIGSYTYYFNEEGIRLTGMQTIGGDTYYFRTNGRMVTGWRTIGGNTYYFDEDGRMADGLRVIDGNTYYFAGGIRQTSWQSVNGRICYFSNNEKRTGVMLTGLRSINSRKYLFDSQGAMQTGWAQIGGERVYFGPSGSMQTGFVWVGEDLYYMDSDGAMQTGWVKAGSSDIYCGEDGIVRRGLQTIDGQIYCFSDAGIMQKGLVTVGSDLMYMGKDGVMVTGWVSPRSSSRMYFGEDGRALKGLYTIDGAKYYFGGDGLMKKGWQYLDGVRYYFDTDGKALTDCRREIAGISYDFDAEGAAYARVKGLAVIDGATYCFENGVSVTGWKTVSGRKYYFTEDGRRAENGLFDADGELCLFDAEGIRLTGSGLKTVNGASYYMNKKSVLQTGFRTVSKKTYYFDPRTYKALTGSHEIGGELYIFTSKG